MSDYVTKQGILNALARFNAKTVERENTALALKADKSSHDSLESEVDTLKDKVGNFSFNENEDNHNVIFEGDQENTWREQTFPNIPLAPNDGVFLCKADSAPASSGSSGFSGQYFADEDYFYICIATNTWRRVALSTF